MTAKRFKDNKQKPKGAAKWEDHYTRKARKENYPARSVYKLEEIQKRYALIRKGDRVLDLGCAPGSWLLYAAGRVGPSGTVVGVDLNPVTLALPPHVRVLAGDVFDMVESPESSLGTGFSGVLSDMAPATTGVKHVDSARSLNLCEAALSAAVRLLRPGGYFVCKIFQGAGFDAFTRTVKSHFGHSALFKPKSCRKASKEIYIIGKERK